MQCKGLICQDQERNETTRSGADGYYARTLFELGFRLIDFAGVRKGDVLLLQLAHRDPDHLALWWGENGANHMLHHAENHRSGRAVVGAVLQATPSRSLSLWLSMITR